MVWIDAQCFAIFCDGFDQLTLLLERETKIVVGWTIVGIDTQRFAIFIDGCIPLSLIVKRLTQRVVGLS